MKKERWRKNKSLSKSGTATTPEELRAIIDHLIHQRELIRDKRIARLEESADTLLKNLKLHKEQILLEELSCFRDVLALHKQTQRTNDKQGN